MIGWLVHGGTWSRLRHLHEVCVWVRLLWWGGRRLRVRERQIIGRRRDGRIWNCEGRVVGGGRLGGQGLQRWIVNWRY